MEGLMNFLGNNYVIFILITLFLIFALVGYVATVKQHKDFPFKLNNDSFQNEELNLNNIEVKNNMSLQDMVKENASHLNDSVNIPDNNSNEML